MFEGKADKILFGGDYNPEQWPENWRNVIKIMIILKGYDMKILSFQTFQE